VPTARLAALTFVLTLGWCDAAAGYVGPGAGFALLSSFLMLGVALALALVSLLVWPFRLLARALRAPARRAAGRSRRAGRVVILGFDGLDPGRTETLMDHGELPHFARLRREGGYARLATSYPSISPAAWSTFMTGADCSYHAIFDFITRDPATYAPMLSSAEVTPGEARVALGGRVLWRARPRVRGLRKSQPFWAILGEHRIWSSVIRVPITFPPERLHGVLLSGMCAPDLKGTQGTFACYTTRRDAAASVEGGITIPVTREGDVIRTTLRGPDGAPAGSPPLGAPLRLVVDAPRQRVEVRVGSARLSLGPGRYSPWVRVSFRAGLLARAHGICRFYLRELEPELTLYVTPLQIDPERPALPVSYPPVYAAYLAKLIGPYGTLGLCEDTWALSEGVLDEDAFLEQAYLYCREREAMLTNALERTPEGVCVCVFDTPDRIQHMFFRCLDPGHPANRGRETARYARVIDDVYRAMDGVLGRLRERLSDDDVLLVLSDHGFAPFRRGVNLNSWLARNGYLVLEDGATRSGDWLAGVDWERTRAFTLGLTGLFINKKGREARGTVGPDDYHALKEELRARLTGLADPDTGETAIRTVVDAETAFAGPYLEHAPDLLVGYNAGYRTSWDAASGRVTESVFEDNTRAWSGDHCIDPALVPGILFASRPLATATPHIRDLAPTVLDLFGLAAPRYMPGRPVLASD
jgi:predicted AlkP superfamily phosphohydrolase/phosphomutase